MAAPLRFRSMRQRLLASFALLVALFFSAGLAGRTATVRMSGVIAETLDDVQADASLSLRLTGLVAQELAAAQAYVDGRDPATRREFERLAAAARGVVREIAARPAASQDEAALLGAVTAQLEALTARYARAHRLVDAGVAAAAAQELRGARGAVVPLLDALRDLSSRKAARVDAASRSLRDEAERSGTWVLALMLLAVVLGVALVSSTLGWIARPLERLAAQAQALSAGDLAARGDEGLPAELRPLADALDGAALSLARAVRVSGATADEVSEAARGLAAVTEQVATAAAQVAGAMGEISAGAEGQVRQLRAIDDALGALRGHAAAAVAGAGDVSALAGAIEASAGARRAELSRSLGDLTAIRDAVGDAAGEVLALNAAADEVNRFVAAVGRLAQQADLVAVNAAIEAGRGGAAGQGFAVVAGELRALADGMQRAADEVARVTGRVRAQVLATTQAMEASVARVGEIAGVSRAVQGALDEMAATASRTRSAAQGAAETATRTALVLEHAGRSAQVVARTAEAYAGAAQQVSASTQEQSAACGQMRAASAQLVRGSVRLRELVGRLQGAPAVPPA